MKKCELCGKPVVGVSDICRECGEKMFEGTPLAELIARADKVDIAFCTKEESD